MLAIYNLLVSLAAILLFPFYGVKMMLTGKYRNSLAQRFGRLPPESLAGLSGSRPRIWFHAVSVGEVTAAAPIIASLRERLPEAGIVLSTTTETGQEMARRIVPSADAFIYYPLDLPFVVRRAINLVKPRVFVPVETELWPNFIHSCHVGGIKIVMVNGRLSSRSFRKYALSRFFWKGVLHELDGLGAISETDAERFRMLGISPQRVQVLGNAKYDSLAAKVSPDVEKEMRRRLNIGPGEPVLVAGSTHEGEDTVILGAYRQLLKSYPELVLIIVPRHPERAPAVLNLIGERGWKGALTMTEIEAGRKRRKEKVILIDVIGELSKVYSLATVIFCGGSLVSRGGQNILEAAAWGKVVFYGPHMDDFSEERAILEEAGAGITVRDEEELLTGILRMLADPGETARRGEKGRRAAARHRGAADRYAGFIESLISEKRKT